MCKTFGVDAWLQTRPGSTTTHPRQNNSRSSGLHLVKVRRKRRRPFHWLGRFFEMFKESSYWLFAEGSNNYRGILCNTCKPFARKIANGTCKIGTQKNPFSIAKVHELGFKLLPNPLYSPDLTRSDFYSETSRSGSGKGVFIWWLWIFLLFPADKKIERALDEMYKSRRRLCWKRNKKFAWKGIFIYFLPYLLNDVCFQSNYTLMFILINNEDSQHCFYAE